MIKKIFMGEGKDSYSAMQGPCADGFHIPSDTELQGLIDTMTALSLIADDYRTKLKIPFAGLCRLIDGIPVSQGSYASLRSSSPIAWGSGVNYLLINSSIGIYNGDRAAGFNIRSFKDSVVIPDGTWAVLYQGTGDAGIYYNSTDGLISISSDGTNWITIADKNIGATVVYNDGDTLSQANCGTYFQRGNNYGFPFTGAVTTDSNQVDTTGYGPDNYYSSSTFITGNNDWSNPANNNLRGGVTGVQKVSNVSGIYLGEPESTAKGPCPRGFHIGRAAYDWGKLKNLLSDIGISSTSDLKNCFKQYLFFPPAGYLNYSDGLLVQDGGTYCWTDTPHGSVGLSTCCRFEIQNSIKWPNGSGIYQGCDYPGYGHNIRPFKNQSISYSELLSEDWVQIYSYNTSHAGIYHNQTLGLVTIMNTNHNTITIMDKNLGATVVYNDGDTLSQSNCGNYYQWGNNYGFPFTGATKTSSSLHNAIGISYTDSYNSDIFILNRWSINSNEDARGYKRGYTNIDSKYNSLRAIYQGEELIYGDYRTIRTPGIYHDPINGLISISSNGVNRVTIADKNLGATTIYNYGDTLSEANCGKYYQRGNNYGFPWNSSASITTDSTQVDASTYGPSNYYNSSTFINPLVGGDWSSVQNDDLWGDTTNTNTARQGPADSGYRVPSKNDRDKLKSELTNLGLDVTDYLCYVELLHIPFSGRRTGNSVSEQGDCAQLRTSSPATGNIEQASYLLIDTVETAIIHDHDRINGLTIRCFKNGFVRPNEGWNIIYQPSA